MLTELSKKDKLWRHIAYKICGNKNEADDLVQEMYIRRYENDRGQPLSEYYIARTMRSIFLNRIKTKKTIEVANIHDSRQMSKKFEPTDEEFELLEKARQLPNTEVELLELSYDYSLRELQDMFNINYGYIYKLTKKAREIILGADFMKKYKNKRLKHRKMSNKPMMGLGDTVEKITQATGIDKVIKVIVGDDCGCEERKEILNALWQHKYKPKCLDEIEIDEYADFIRTRKFTLSGNGKAEGKLQDAEIKFVCEYFALVFNRSVWEPDCRSCRGTVLTLIGMIYKLDTVFYNNIKTKSDEDTTKI